MHFGCTVKSTYSFQLLDFSLILSSIGYEQLMFLFTFCAFDCGLCLLVLLTITAIITSLCGNIIHHDTIQFITMPVTTRSQSKLLTGSNLALSQVISTGSTALLDISDKSTSQRNNNHPSSPVNLLIPSTCHPLRISKLYSDFPTPELSHNFENLQTFSMEADCKETLSDTMA